MPYRRFTFHENSEELLALLSMMPFESFEELDDHLLGYIRIDLCDDDFYNDLRLICASRKVDFEENDIEETNWNALWESSFEPVVVDDFCAIKAGFHNLVAETSYIIQIDPRMAFGTGHHETTYMMIQLMRNLDFVEKIVLDYGSGTGILSILAEFLGATSIDALDIESDAVENIHENMSINQCRNIKPYLGDLDILNRINYDIILANINRNVLLKNAGKLSRLISGGGILLLSGILVEDEQIVLDTYLENGFELSNKQTRGQWLAISLRFPNR